MLSVSDHFDKTSSIYSGAQLPLKHLMSKDSGGDDVYVPPPSYPWTNSMSSAEFDKNLILSGLTTTKIRNVKPMNILLTSLKSAFSPTEYERVMLEKRTLPMTADEAFQKNQLAPLTFLRNPSWSNLLPSNFIARAWSCCLNLPCEAYFFVEPKKLFSSRHYVATVIGPSNYVCPFQMRVEADEHGKEIRYAYSFQPSEAGVYTVKVRLAASGTPDVHGSPLKINVCSNTYTPPVHYSRPNNLLPRQPPQPQSHCSNGHHINRVNHNNNRSRNWIPQQPQQQQQQQVSVNTIGNNDNRGNSSMYCGVHHSCPCPSCSMSGYSGMMMTYG